LYGVAVVVVVAVYNGTIYIGLLYDIIVWYCFQNTFLNLYVNIVMIELRNDKRDYGIK
tara:strand:+ start:368 stop:541 length:174 start_codon:yes stop_codon:yes gene_type:complete